MISLNRQLICIFPLLTLALAGGCSDVPAADGGSGGIPGAGGATPGVGGASSGGASAGTGGVSTGGGNQGSGGGLATGGSAPGTGGGVSSGGASNTGGTSGGTGGASAGSGGAGSEGPVFHVFMLMGQSNMAGVATREASDSNTDDRMLVLGGCGHPALQWSVVTNPPLSECPGEKGWNLSDSVDPGIWFGKTLLPALPEGDTLGLVGTAESGEAISTFMQGGVHHQMILNKITAAKTGENVHFSGIIFHQGESDCGSPDWPGKVVTLYEQVKAAWGVDYDVPFILGEIPNDSDCKGHNTRVHEAADLLPMGYWISQEGTGIIDDYHFNHASVVLMGQRYGATMIEALGW